jgi:hypothetical protein
MRKKEGQMWTAAVNTHSGEMVVVEKAVKTQLLT